MQMDLSLTGSQIGSARSKGSSSTRSAKSNVPSARTRHNMLVNANGNARRPSSGKVSTKQNFMSMIDAGAKGASKAKEPAPVAMGNRNELKYRSAGDLTLKSTSIGAPQRRAESPPFDSGRTESTLEPQPVRRGDEHLIDTALCLSSLQSLDKWLESSVALADNHDWQEIPLVDSQMSVFSEQGYDELVSVSQRSPNPNFGRCPPKPPLAPEPRLQLNNSATLGGGAAGGGGVGRPTGKVSSIENLRSKEPVNLMRGAMGLRSEEEKRALAAVRITSRPSRPAEAVEVLVLRLNRSARIIQKWWRSNRSRLAASRAAQAALRRMMEQKQRDLNQDLQQQQQQQQPVRQRKEEKARAERQRAITELHRRREEKADRQTALAKAEVERLKTEGKVGGSPRRHKPTGGSAKAAERQSKARQEPRPKESEKRPEVEEAQSAVSVASRPSQLSDVLSDFEAAEQKSLNASFRSERTVTTIDDICKALRELEESDSIQGEKEKEKEEKAAPKSAWMADIDRLLADDASSVAMPLPASLTAARLREHELSLTIDAPQPPATAPLPADNLAQVSNESRAAVEEVASAVALQRRALDEKAHEVVVLERALLQQEEKSVTTMASVRVEMAQQMAAKQEEYQAQLQRKHELIEQLFEQKKELQTKCEAYVTEMRGMKEKFEKVLRQLQDKHDVEMKKLKEKHVAAEKLRMERWEDRKTKEIREDTVKGVASELQVLMDQQKRARADLVEKHKRELTGIRAEFESKLVSADERAEKRYFDRVQELREELTREKENACDREREMAKQRFESQLTNELQALEAKRRQLYAELEEERERQSAAAAKQRSELDRERQRLEAFREASSETLTRDFESARAEAERRHESELREAKERLAVEKEAWLETQMKRQQAWAMAKEREVREALKQERDRELERVVEELEKDRSAFREEIERSSESKLRRLREKLEAENTEFERSERAAMEKYNRIKAEMLETSGENEKLKVLLRQKEEETSEISKHYEKLHRERTKVSDVVREEFAEQLLTTGEENKTLKMEMAELRARHRIELDKERTRAQKIEEEKEEELAAIHRKVKEAIKKKDDNLLDLRMQHEAALKRAENFEQLLMQQREQLLALKK